MASSTLSLIVQRVRPFSEVGLLHLFFSWPGEPPLFPSLILSVCYDLGIKDSFEGLAPMVVVLRSNWIMKFNCWPP